MRSKRLPMKKSVFIRPNSRDQPALSLLKGWLKNQTSIPVPVLALLGLILVGTPVYAQPETDPFRPTVNRRESEWILEAQAKGVDKLEEAIEELTRRDISGGSAALDFTLGNLHFQAGQHEQAAAAYAKALEKFPSFRNAKINLGRIYLILEREADAIRLYQELVRDGVADAETYLLLGHALMMESFPVSAENAYRQALLLDQNAVEAKRGLLSALMSQERHREGLMLAKELLIQEPGQREYWAALANAQLALGEMAAAAGSLEQARRLGSADADMLATLGELYLQQQVPAEASARFLEAFEMGEDRLPRRERAINGLLQLGALAEAEQLLKGFKTRFGDLPEAEKAKWELSYLRLQSRVDLEKGNLEEALRKGQQILESDPLDGATLLMVARIYEERGEVEQALGYCERAARIRGVEADALIQQALIEVGRQRVETAIRLLERAQAFEENAGVARYLRQLRQME